MNIARVRKFNNSYYITQINAVNKGITDEISASQLAWQNSFYLL
jgi:hypothetical protein